MPSLIAWPSKQRSPRQRIPTALILCIVTLIASVGLLAILMPMMSSSRQYEIKTSVTERDDALQETLGEQIRSLRDEVSELSRDVAHLRQQLELLGEVISEV